MSLMNQYKAAVGAIREAEQAIQADFAGVITIAPYRDGVKVRDAENDNTIFLRESQAQWLVVQLTRIFSIGEVVDESPIIQEEV